MTRRSLFALLGLPFIAPAARVVDAVRARLRKPDWSIDLEIESRAPLVLAVHWPGGRKERLAFPLNGRRYLHVPMFCPRPPEIQLTIESARAFRFYGCQFES